MTDTTDKEILDTVSSMVRKPPYKDDDFDSGWNNALWALLDELGLGDDEPGENL